MKRFLPFSKHFKAFPIFKPLAAEDAGTVALDVTMLCFRGCCLASTTLQRFPRELRCITLSGKWSTTSRQTAPVSSAVSFTLSLPTSSLSALEGRLRTVCVPPHVGASVANQEWGGAPAAGRRALYRGGGDGGGGEKLSEDHPEFASCGMYQPQPLPLCKSRV